MGIINVLTNKNDSMKRNFEFIDINLLHSGLAYQRPIDEEFVRDKVEHFDKNEVNAPCVSLRDGKYNVVDGQHTIAICKEMGWKKIRCEVRKGLSFQEENDWFVITNTKHRPQSKNRILNGRYFGGKDKTLNSLISCLSAVGYKLKTADVTISNGVINASETIENIYKELGKDDFIKYITLHSGIWEGNLTSLKASFLKGFKKFYITYKNELDNKRCVSVFTKYKNSKNTNGKSPEDITNEANTDVYTKDVQVKYARVFVKYYNVKIANNRKLKMSKLDD
jgi:hypothetical protein